MKHHGDRVVVIGSGPSGAMAALTLVNRGVPVTLLESGQHVPDGFLVRAMGRNIIRRRQLANSAAAVTSTSSGGGAWVQSLVPGGLSNYWVGAAPRFAPDDFCEGARLDERFRWPVGYDELLPYYQRAERILRIVGEPVDVPNLPGPVVLRTRKLPGNWRSIARYAATLGYGLGPMPMADGPDWMVTRTGVGFNSFTHVVQPLLKSPNFELKLGAHALRLEWDSDSKSVSSVIFRNRATDLDERMAAAAVVVAAGPLASTKLLLNSTSADFPEGLGNTHGLLGTHLHEHPSQWFPLELTRERLPRLAQAAYLTRGPVESSTPLLAAGCTIGFTSNREKLVSVFPAPSRRFGVMVFGTMVPRAENTLLPHPTAIDQFGLSMLEPRVTYSAEELSNLTAARTKLREILDGAGYACSVPRYVPDPVPGRSVHYGGTVRMHRSRQYGVLNGWSRLHAVDNVVVADASAFTTGVEKNPTLTAMALAARACERLVDDLKSA